MSSQTLSDYFTYMDSLSRSLDSNPGATRALLHLIEQYKDEAADDRSKGEFFKGEYAFYSGQYERALKHYLEAKDVEDFEFFCYRASAYVSKVQGNLEKAIKFAEKARAVFSDDFPTLSLLKTLFEQSERYAEAEHIAQHMQTLKGSVDNQEAACENLSKITLGEKEIKELVGIFEPHVEEQLFAEEALTTSKHPVSFSMQQFGSLDAPMEKSCKIENPSNSFSEDLEGSILSFQRQQSDLLNSYIKTWAERPALPDHCLYVFQGWHQQSVSIHDLIKTAPDTVPFWLTETLRKSSGGFYLRWNGKGIAINPGRYFIRELHRQGLHVKDIDYVISTHENSDSYADIKEIWELNYRMNSVAHSTHVIHYYLNQPVYRSLSNMLKPHFKQERDAIHCLELFIDSPEVEKLELGPDIRLHYFPGFSDRDISTRSRDKFIHPEALGIRLELALPVDHGKVINVGYISEMAWSPLLSHRLGPCDILLAGFGNTNSSDYNKKDYEEGVLGYFGIYSLLEEVAPRLLLCTEFGGREGDIRLEIIRRMRDEYVKGPCAAAECPVILPADTGLFVDLAGLRVKCSTSGALVKASDVRVTNPSGAFGHLCYLAPQCCL